MKSKHRIVKWQPTRDKETFTSDPYHAWLEQQGFTTEPALANPDVLAEKDTSSEADEFADNFIDEDGKVKLLSAMEQNIFDLHIKQGMSLTDVYKHLKISKSSVRVYFRRMQKKLKVLYSSL